MFDDAIMMFLFLVPGYVARVFSGIKMAGLKGGKVEGNGIWSVATGIIWGIPVLAPLFALPSGWKPSDFASALANGDSLAATFLQFSVIGKYWLLLMWAAFEGLLWGSLVGPRYSRNLAHIFGNKTADEYQKWVTGEDSNEASGPSTPR